MLDDGAVENDEGFSAGGIAAVLHAVLGVTHGFSQRHQYRHVLRAAACHDAVDSHAPDGRGAAVGQDDAQRFIRMAVGETQEGLDVRLGRRHDGQAVAQLVLVKVAIDHLETTLGDDTPGARFTTLAGRGRHVRQVIDHPGQGHRQDVLAQFLGPLHPGVPWHQGHRQVGKAQLDGGGGCLTDKPFTGQ